MIELTVGRAAEAPHRRAILVSALFLSWALLASGCAPRPVKTASASETPPSAPVEQAPTTPRAVPPPLDIPTEIEAPSNNGVVPEHVRARAEWEPVHGVIISYQGFENWGQELAVRILETGAELFLVLPEDEEEVDSSTWTAREIRHHLEDLAREMKREDRLSFVDHDTFGGWVRDYAPYPVEVTQQGSRRLEVVDSRYYESRPVDDAFPEALTHQLYQQRGVEVTRRELPIQLEWGNFMTDGQGGCALTEAIFPANDGLPQRDMAIYEGLATHLGCDLNRLLLVPHTDLTIGHIDEVAKFLPDRQVVVATLHIAYDPDDPEAGVMRLTPREEEAARVLDEIALRFEAQGYTVSRVPTLPGYAGDHEAVLRSYANSLLVNGHLLLPSYRRAQDHVRGVRLDKLEAQVAETYRRLLPGYKILTVEASDAVELEGSVHCLTMSVALPLPTP